MSITVFRTRRPIPQAFAAAAIVAAALAAAGCAGGSGDQPHGKAPVASGDSVETALQHAEAAFKDGDYAEAQVAYEAAMAIQPGNPQAVAGLGTCYLKNHQVKKAGELLAGHLRDSPGNTAARLVLARALVRQAQFQEAAIELRRVLEIDPDNLLAHYNLGFIAYRSRDYDAALVHLRRTLELRPDHPEAHYTLGLTYMALERYDDAVASLERAIAIDPKHVGSHFNLASAAARAGRADLAIREQKIYAEISGRSKADAERAEQVKAASLGAVEALMAGKYTEALHEYQKLLAENRDYAPLYNDIGRVQLKLGQRQEALESLRRAAELDPKLSEPHYLLSNLYREMGDEASSSRERALFAALETIPEGKSAY
jgi:tetratricopeptide (TPR) repeat protein